MFNYQISDIIRPEAATKLENNFRKFILTTPQLAEKVILFKFNLIKKNFFKFSKLPHRVIYYPIISACYNR